MSEFISVQKSSVIWPTIKVIIRFFTGAHLNGKTYNDSTWRLDASPMYRKRRGAYTWWRRKARWKRAAWRNSVFWATMFLIYSFAWSISSTLIILGAMSPALGYLGFKRTRLALFLPVVGHHSDGSNYQTWVMKPAWRKRVNKLLRRERARPGLARKDELAKRIRVEEIPTEYKRAVVHEMRNEMDQPPIELKLLMSPDD